MRANVRRHAIARFVGCCCAAIVVLASALVALPPAQTAQAAETAQAAQSAAPTLTSQPNTASLVLVARFSDERARNTYNGTDEGSSKTRWSYLMENFNSTTATTGSFRNYIANASLGKLNVLSVFPQDKKDGTLTYLDLDIPSSQCNNNDAVIMAVAAAMKKQYPNWHADPEVNLERDGEEKDYLDNVMVFLDTARTDMRARMANMSGQASIGGLRVGGFELLSYSPLVAADSTPAHEYLHARGALDLYREGNTANSPKLANRWDIMATSLPSLLPLAITAKDSGFINAIDEVGSGTYTLNTYVSGQRHAIAFRSPLNEDEYFVAEYRQADNPGINGYVTDRYIGGKLGSTKNSDYDGVIVYRVNAKYGPTGSEASGNIKHDYVYVFRPGDQPTQSEPGGSGVGDIENANLRTGESIGTTNAADDVSKHAIVYSNGVNSRITLNVVTMANGSATIQLKIPDYADQSLWNTEKGPNAATSTTVSGGNPSLAAAGTTLWGALAGFDSTKVITSTGSGWVENTTASNGMTVANVTAHGDKAVITGLNRSKQILVRTQSGNAWAHDKTITGSFDSAQSVSRDGGLYTLGFSQSNKAVSVYRTDGEVKQLGGTVTGTYISDAVMLDGTHLAVADFFGNALRLYTLTNNVWNLSQTIAYTHRTLSSATVGKKTLLLATASEGGKIYSFESGKLVEATGSAPRFGDTASLSSDGSSFHMAYTVTGAGNVTSVVSATSQDGTTWNKLGDNVMQPAYTTSNVAVLGSKAFVLAGTSSSFQLRSHAVQRPAQPESKPASGSETETSSGSGTASKPESSSKPVAVTPPVARSGLVFNDRVQVGVPSGAGYVVSSGSARDAGSYVATVKLRDGFVWSDGSKDVKRLSWSIARAVPSVVSPSGLLGVRGARLSSVGLPSGWSWVDGSAVLSVVGVMRFSASYRVSGGNYGSVSRVLEVRVSRGSLGRVSGATRYETMAGLVREAFPSRVSTVVVASGSNYPDALAASGLAGVLGAPVVLTDPGVLSARAEEQVRRLSPSRVVVVGGASAVSSRVASRLRALGAVVERVSGATRYDTSYRLYARGAGSWGSTAVVATGAGYADALSVGSYAYAAKAPVFLCDPSRGLSAVQRAALSRFSRVVVVGGERAVPSRLVSGLRGVVRVAGATRYATSVAVARWARSNGLGMQGVVYATGANYADALSGAALAGRSRAVMLLVSSGSGEAVSYSAGFRGRVSRAYVAGGVGAVGRPVAEAIADALDVARP